MIFYLCTENTSCMTYEKLISVRKIKGFTQEKLAKYIAMEQTTLSRKERGLSPISDEEWQRIASALQVPLEEIKETLNDPSQNVNCTFTDQSVGIQYVTIPTEILDKLLKSKDEQIELLKELLAKK